MRFDVIVGNPPYQEGDSGHAKSAAPIYQHFFRQAIALRPRSICMIIPARWFAGGKGLGSFRKEMLEDKNIRLVDDFPNASIVFEEVQIKGGVSIVVRAEHPTSEMTIISNLDPNQPVSFTRDHLVPHRDVFIRFPMAESVLGKILEPPRPAGETTPFMDELVSVRRPFGLGAGERGDPGASEENSLLLHHKGGRARILSDRIASGRNLAAAWKIFIPRLASGSDKFPHPVLGRAFIGAPGEVCTETYLAIGPFLSEEIAINAKSYIDTRIFRYLCLLRKSSQDTPRTVFKFAPVQNFIQSWSDEKLIERYRISTDEWQEIEKLVSRLP